MPAVDAGMTEDRFWLSSPREIVDFIESYNRRKRQKRKEEIQDLFTLARIIAQDFMADKDHPEPRPWDYYPQLFASEKQAIEQTEEEEKFEDYKEQKRAYIKAFNARFRQQTEGVKNE